MAMAEATSCSGEGGGEAPAAGDGGEGGGKAPAAGDGGDGTAAEPCGESVDEEPRCTALNAVTDARATLAPPDMAGSPGTLAPSLWTVAGMALAAGALAEALTEGPNASPLPLRREVASTHVPLPEGREVAQTHVLLPWRREEAQAQCTALNAVADCTALDAVANDGVKTPASALGEDLARGTLALPVVSAALPGTLAPSVLKTGVALAVKALARCTALRVADDGVRTPASTRGEGLLRRTFAPRGLPAALLGTPAPSVMTTGDVDDAALAVGALAVSNGAARSGMARTVEVPARWCVDGGAEAALATMALAAEAVSVDMEGWAVMTRGEAVDVSPVVRLSNDAEVSGSGRKEVLEMLQGLA